MNELRIVIHNNCFLKGFDMLFNTHLVKLKNNLPLSMKKRQTFDSLLQIIDTAEKEHKIRIAYRGEKKKKLEKKMDAIYGTDQFFERLYFFGEKAKYFSKNSQITLANTPYITSINDISDNTFKFIFAKLHDIFVAEHRNGGNTEEAVTIFKNNHHDFLNFFNQEDNLNLFIELISQINNNFDEKIKIRDYYLYLLHTFKSDKFSFFVSASSDREVAKHFAISGEENEKGAVIFYYLVPEPTYKYAVSIESNQISYSLCEKLKLPIYSHNFYPEQKEVAVKGALFPHFILGIEDLEHDNFIVNPHIFRQKATDISLIPQQGLIIDQSNFENKIRETGYAGFVRMWGDADTYASYFHR